MNQKELFASSQIISFNPIIKENDETRIQYFIYLKKILQSLKWEKRKYCKAQMKFYKQVLCCEESIVNINTTSSIKKKFCIFIPFDITCISAFNDDLDNKEIVKNIVKKIASDVGLTADEAKVFEKCFYAAMGDESSWDEILNSKFVNGVKTALKNIRDNIEFIRKKPYEMLITATMSAGKSTVINSLVGKNISLVQNMACTSKIHTIVSKHSEDGVISEYDHDLSINATKDELLNDNEDNKTTKITVSTYFNSKIGGQRVILYDSPGVNSSENIEHKQISTSMIRSKKYNSLLYVLNATQLGTTDDDEHLSTVKSYVGRKPIIFVLNKIDRLISDDDNILDVIENQRKYLISKGFKKAIICPVSARAAFLAKKSQCESLSRTEQREMDTFLDKFEVQSLSEYYEKTFNMNYKVDANNESQKLFKDCGFAYFEEILKSLIEWR